MPALSSACLVVGLIACMHGRLPAAPLSSLACSSSTSHRHPSSSKWQARAGDVTKAPTARCCVPARPRPFPAGACRVPHEDGVALCGVARVVPDARALHHPHGVSAHAVPHARPAYRADTPIDTVKHGLVARPVAEAPPTIPSGISPPYSAAWAHARSTTHLHTTPLSFLPPSQV